MSAQGVQRDSTLYSVLGLEIKASPDAIRARYLKLARLWHPDRFQGRKAEEETAKRKFQEIVSAFEVLSDEQRRQQYDLELLELLDVEDYLQRFQGLILTVCGLGMASGNLMSVEEPSCSMKPPGHAHLHHLRVTKRWLLTA